MATEYSTLDLNYSYRKVEYQEYEIDYSYNLISYDIATYDFVHSFSAQTHATTSSFTGHWSDQTQIICNALPLWHAGRYNNTSNYQQFINSFAINDETNYRDFRTNRKNIFLSTVELDDIYSGHVADYPKNLPDMSDRNVTNLIYNSDFSLPRRAISELPCRWAVAKSTGSTVKINSEICLSAGNSLEFNTPSGEYGVAYQSYNYNFPKNQDLTLSAIVNVPNNLTGVDNNASGSANISLEVLYVDGTLERSSVNIPLSTTESGYLETNLTGVNTSVYISHWQKVHTKLSLSKPSSLVKCFINSDYSNNTSDFLFYVDCIQLEEGATPTRWKKSISDRIPWMYQNINYLPPLYDVYANDTSMYTSQSIVLNSNTSYIKSTSKESLYYTTEESDFFYESIPTRLVSVETSSNTGITRLRQGSITNVYDTRILNASYRVDPKDSAKIKKESYGIHDDFGSYKIAEKDYFGTDPTEYTVLTDHYSSGNISYSLEIKGLTFNGETLVAFCKESLDSEIYYTFKFIKAKSSMTGDYFECMQDFKVSDSTKDLFVAVEAGDIVFNSLGKLEGEKNKFIIEASNGVKYEALFAYDYYIDAGNGQFLTREKYDQICIT